MKTEIWVSFNYGGWHLSFQKKFDLPFAPFYGLWLYDGKGAFEHEVRLENNDYCFTVIGYDTSRNVFDVNVRNSWKKPVRDDVIDETIKSFKDAGWKRMDTTDVKDLKELMNREYAHTG